MITLKPDLTAESLQATITDKRIGSFTQLAKEYGYLSKISGKMIKRFRAVLPNIDDLLKANAAQSSTTSPKDKPSDTAIDNLKQVTLDSLKKSHIRKVLDDVKPRSMEEIYNALDFKGTMDELTAKIEFWYPSIEWMMGENAGTNKPKEPKQKTLKDTKPTKTTKASKKSNAAIDRPTNKTAINPFRPGTNYSICWEVVFKASKKMVNRTELVKLYAQEAGIPKEKAAYDMAVILSPKADGTCHQSAQRASDVYWVRRGEGDRGYVQMVLKGGNKGKG